MAEFVHNIKLLLTVGYYFGTALGFVAGRLVGWWGLAVIALIGTVDIATRVLAP